MKKQIYYKILQVSTVLSQCTNFITDMFYVISPRSQQDFSWAWSRPYPLNVVHGDGLQFKMLKMFTASFCDCLYGVLSGSVSSWARKIWDYSYTTYSYGTCTSFSAPFYAPLTFWTLILRSALFVLQVMAAQALLYHISVYQSTAPIHHIHQLLACILNAAQDIYMPLVPTYWHAFP